MGRITLLVYRVAMTLLLPLIFVRYILKALFTASYRERLAERFGLLPEGLPERPIWVHAVSVGEVNAAVPLVLNLLQNQDRPVLMTCVTPTGSAQIRKSLGEKVAHIYAPVDAGIIIHRFLQRLKPAMVVIMETELWPNLIHQSTSNQVPVAFANMRISDGTYTRASRFRQLSRYILKDVSAFCVQTEEDSRRIVDLGALDSKTDVTGNLKFDVVAPTDVLERGLEIRTRLGGAEKKVIVLGSSHEGEEMAFLDVLESTRDTFPATSIVGVIVPRHPERFDSVSEYITRRGLQVTRWSESKESLPDSVDVLLVDTMGELMEFYAAGDIAVVGGSFVPVGGHNILEPLMVGTPVLFGPEMSNFRQIAELVLAANSGCQVADESELANKLASLLNQAGLREEMTANGYRLLEDNRGSVNRTEKKLLSLI